MSDLLPTQEEVEFRKCADDFSHFASNWIKIYHPKQGLIPLGLYPYQERLVHDYENNRFNILTKFRAGGFTTTTLLWLLWRCMFKLDERVLYCCKTDREAIHGSRIIKQALDNFPDWLKPKLGKNNDHYIQFEETGGEFNFHSMTAGRGRSVRWLVIDEAAFIPKMESHWKALWPTLSCGGNCIVLSTPNGANGWFFDTYTSAQAGKNNFHVYHADYHEHPDYNNAQWVAMVKENLGQAGWAQEVLQSFLSSLLPDDGK